MILIIMQYLYYKYKAYEKFLVTIILSLLLSNHSFADKKFDKDLKKVSKDNGLIKKNGKIYSIDNISDKKILF